MEKINIRFIINLVTTILMIITFNACKKDNSGAAPVITRVRTVSKDSTFLNVTTRVTLDSSSKSNVSQFIPKDSTTKTGSLNNLYAIVGQHLSTTTQVLFNGASVYFNPALVTDNSIIVQIPLNAPWGASASNKVTVVTRYGSVNAPFTILQPAPVITSFTPLAGSAGDTITISGTTLDGVTAVKFDSFTAKIVGQPTSTQIKVVVPPNVSQAYLYVTTPGGTAKSANAFGFKYLVYDDALANGWWVGGWNGGDQPNFKNTSPVLRGTNSIKVTYTGPYAGFQVGNGGAPIDISGMSYFKISIYGGSGTTGNVLRLSLVGPDANGHVVSNTNNPPDGVTVNLIAGQWQTFTFPLTAFGTRPVTLQQVIVQELSGVSTETIYIDDIGLL